MSDDREARLPKWAQYEFSVLRQDLRRCQRLLEEDNTAKTNTYAGSFGDVRALPNNSAVTFWLNEDDRVIVRVRPGRFKGEAVDVLQIMCQERLITSGTGGVNTIEIGVDAL